jgi:hypothetical protein
MKQAGLGVIQYLQDYDETYPMSVYRARNNQNQECAYTMLSAIEPYVRNKDLYECPSARQAMDLDAFWRQFGLPGGDCGQFRWLSYVANFALFEDGPNNTITGAQNQPPIKQAELDLVVETAAYSGRAAYCSRWYRQLQLVQLARRGAPQRDGLGRLCGWAREVDEGDPRRCVLHQHLQQALPPLVRDIAPIQS